MVSVPASPPSETNVGVDAADLSIEQRQDDARGPISLRVDYKRLNSFFADYTKNISRGGTFIQTDRPLAVGTEFLFELGVPVTDPALGEGRFRLSGVVKWVVKSSEATDGRPPGMGIRFLFPDRADEERLTAFVRKLMQLSLGRHIADRLMAKGRVVG
ncbi:MAG TPA: TIGR02266 family protein [Polyangiaceae bacterium]|nr:TIGR02266 family protein [Polyangiaceae bacterium]